jgi:hypothetical protein
VVLGERTVFSDYYDSQLTGRFQNKFRYLRKLRVNCELQAARNIVGHSAFVNAIIRLAVEENGGAARAKARAKTAAPDGSVKAALDINQLSPVEALTKLYELQRRVTGMCQNHEIKRGAKI